MRRDVGPGLVGAVLLIAIPWAALGQGIGSDTAAIEKARRQSQQTQAAGSGTPAAPEQQEPASWDQDKPCENPPSHEEADLCQQWRMAKATEELRTTADAQLSATRAEAGLLAVTVVFTAIAAIAAVIAARAAQASVGVASAIGKVQLRAYVSVTKVVAVVRNTGHWIESTATLVVLTNSGQTPAHLNGFDVQIGIEAGTTRIAQVSTQYREIGPGTDMVARDIVSVGLGIDQIGGVPKIGKFVTVNVRFQYQDYLGQNWRKLARFKGPIQSDRLSKSGRATTIVLNQEAVSDSEEWDYFGRTNTTSALSAAASPIPRAQRHTAGRSYTASSAVMGGPPDRPALAPRKSDGIPPRSPIRP